MFFTRLVEKQRGGMSQQASFILAKTCVFLIFKLPKSW